ncbi:MAG: rhodanese-like domain-containing protein [Patescibacteria group bacterium]
MLFTKSLMITIVASLGAGIIGSLAMYTIMKPASAKPPTAQELIRDFYATETAVHVSPHSLRRKMDKGDTSFILVDVRSPQEYEKEHIIGAINIPAYKDPDTAIAYETDKDAKKRIIDAFRALPQGKDIIVYCYSIPCMTGRKIGDLLAGEDIYVKALGIGWNEWRHAWTSWNHEHEWAVTKPEDYIQTGKEPGKPVQREIPSTCGEGELSC